MQTKTRLFFVVDSVGVNEELYETLELAELAYDYLNDTGKNARLYVAIVRNAYQVPDGWNYDDQSDTFEIIKKLK